MGNSTLTEADLEDSAVHRSKHAKSQHSRSSTSTPNWSASGTTNMETYNGLVRTPTDAIILFEACRLGLLPRVQRRLSEKERQSIRSGSVFVWDEREAGMRRWTDGKSWSASRVSGSFLTYREMEGKRGSSTFVSPANRTTKTPESAGGGDEPEDGAEGPDGYRYKPDGLMKQSFSITTSQGQHLHLISYYSRSSPTAQVLRQPSQDPNLASIQPAKGMYPESTVSDQASLPAVTRSPMAGAPGYVMAPNQPYGRAPQHPQAYLPPGYMPHHPYMGYPMNPMPAPPQYALPYGQPGLPPLGYHPAYPQQPLPMNQVPPLAYDQRPLRAPDSRLPGAPIGQQNSVAPPPYTQSAPPPPVTQPYPQSSYVTASAPAQQESRNDSAAAALDPRLDPRLSASLPAETQPQQHPPYPPQTSQPHDEPQTERLAEPKPVENGGSVPASQAPTINALVTGLQEAAKSATNGEAQDRSAATPTRDGSTSPGGTKHGAPPQDIPSEKLGFREDKRVLSMLDRSFARV